MKWDTDHNAAPDAVPRGAIGIRRQWNVASIILSADGEVDNVEDDAEAAGNDEQ